MSELEAHKRVIEQSNRAARAWDCDEKFDELFRLCAIVGSHMISAGEAAWRQDEKLLTTHLGHAREALILALRMVKNGVGHPL